MKRNILIVFLAGVIGLTVSAFLWQKISRPHGPLIAIVTTLSHPALTQVRAAFIASMGHSQEFVDFNAEGSMQSANLIARQIAHNPHIVGILAIGTLAAQSLAKVEKKRPLVITAVSDPNAIFLDQAAKNICGLSDSIDAAYQIDKIISMLPGIKSLSLLYSPHEANSALVVNNLALVGAAKNLAIDLVGVYEPQQIASASLKACQTSDAVLIPLDNQLVAAMPSIIKATKDKSCPIITSNESPIHQGATIAFGIDYEKSGNEAGLIMKNILAGKSTPAEIGFINPRELGIYINKRAIIEKKINVKPTLDAHIISGE